MQINPSGLHIIVLGRVQGVLYSALYRAKSRSIRNFQKSIRWFCRDFCLWRCFKTGSIQEMVHCPRDAFVQLECHKIAFEEVKGFETIG